MRERILGTAVLVLCGVAMFITMSLAESAAIVTATAHAATTRPSPDNAKPADHPDNFTSTSYMLRGYCYAWSDVKDDKALGGFGRSDNWPHPITSPAAHASRSWYLLAEPEVVTKVGDAKGMRLTLVNATGSTLAFDASDSRLSIVQEAIDDKGTWRSVENLPSSWCGNSYHRLMLPSGQFWSFSAPRYQGEHKTKLRFRMNVGKETMYSNEFEGSVNLSQFTTQQPYQPRGIMDPNFEVPATQPVK
jgi:hypothetical protein